MSDLDRVPEGIDTTVPSVARTYDHLLGGAHNPAVDRAMGDQLPEVLPGARDLVRLNRSFLRRAVTHLAEPGVRQFPDTGSDIPTAGNVHGIVREVAPDGRVVYVDKEPVAVALSHLLPADDGNTAAVRADLREPEGVVGRPDDQVRAGVGRKPDPQPRREPVAGGRW